MWDGIFCPSPGWFTGGNRLVESKRDEMWGQFNKCGATVEMVLGSGKGCGKNGGFPKFGRSKRLDVYAYWRQ